ncbi:MAG: hypothetical protein P4L49_18965 [Desulfosporosinus sp.]|nr:hypothetical protein [Desulfosporosinus sp.]
MALSYIAKYEFYYTVGSIGDSMINVKGEFKLQNTRLSVTEPYSDDYVDDTFPSTILHTSMITEVFIPSDAGSVKAVVTNPSVLTCEDGRISLNINGQYVWQIQ